MKPLLARLTESATVSGANAVPKVRFGRTELQMPIVTCGGMRMQQSWNRGGAAVKDESDITAECQANFVAILRQALALGINHFETARGYGCSEMQYGMALKTLLGSGEVKREDIIVQTKAGASSSAADFRQTLETCFSTLGLDYVDLFAFHGITTCVV